MSLIHIKKPGADLKDFYIINLEAGFILALVALIALFRYDFDATSEFTIVQVEQEVIHMEEIIRTEQIQRPPPPPRPPAPVMVPNEEIVEDAFFDLSTDFSFDAILSVPPPPLMPVEAVEVFDEEEIFTIVEEMPVLIGGTSTIYEYLRYPEIAQMAGIQGRIIIQFVIDQQGNVHDPVIIRGIGGGCDEAALEAVKKLTFVPGRQRGRAVKVRYSLPIVFKLAT